MEKLKQAKSEYLDNNVFCDGITTFEKFIAGKAFIAGANYQAEKMYNEQELLNILYKHTEDLLSGKKVKLEEWFEQFKKK